MSKISWVVGVDEAGRGPLAGPVSVAAVAVRAEVYQRERALFKGIRDSKKLSEQAREEWYTRLKIFERENKIRCAVSLVSNTVIDEKGIMYAIRLALIRSLKKLHIAPHDARVVLDGSLFAPREWKDQKTIIRGDSTVQIIAAASILAKVRRDRRMRHLSSLYPKYHFEVHKGYGSMEHRRSIRRYGLSPAHRKSFCRSLPKLAR